MPIFNGIEFIDDSVPTIMYQTFQNWELIIGINGHAQNSETYKIAKKYENKDARIKVMDLHEIKGKSEALNEMLRHCQYDWVSLLDVDDKWLPLKLTSQLPYMTDYDVIGTQCKYFGDLNAVPRIPVGNLMGYNFLACNPIINSSCLLRKELCFWDKTVDGVEDYDLWLRLWERGKKFYNVIGVQVMHRIHQDSAFNAKGNHSKVDELLGKFR